jgi:hypothetical protein
MPNAAVQPQIRAQREFVGWNCLLGLFLGIGYLEVCQLSTLPLSE